MISSLWFFSPRKPIYGVGVGVGWPPGDPRGRGRAQGARPPPSWTGCGPPGLHLWRWFFIIFSKVFHGVSGHSENFIFCTKNNTIAVLLKTASVRVSSIQIIQVRVQNKGKSVWKSRYVGDVSNPPSLNLCLSSSNSVDKLKVRKKNFYELFCSCLHK